LADFATIKIPVSLKEEIQYYRKKNHAKDPFNKFVIAQLEDALQEQILKSMARLERSYMCKDANPKTRRLTFTVVGKTSEYFVCEECAKLHIFQNMDSEETVKWGDFKTQ
jgi:hypothetical protein